MKDEKTGLGFSVYGGVSKGGCYIRDVVADPALSDGRLQTGDRLLKVPSLPTAKSKIHCIQLKVNNHILTLVCAAVFNENLQLPDIF